MIVVADASPLRYLGLIEEAEILPGLYGGVLIPPSSLKELTQPRTPETSTQLDRRAPGWLQARAPLAPILGFPATLGAGEQEATALAEEVHAEVLLSMIGPVGSRRSGVI